MAFDTLVFAAHHADSLADRFPGQGPFYVIADPDADEEQFVVCSIETLERFYQGTPDSAILHAAGC